MLTTNRVPSQGADGTGRRTNVWEKGCIVDKIHEFQATLKDPARSVEAFPELR
jgi:hypothetical protein